MSSTCTQSPDPGDRGEPYETWMVFVDPESGATVSGVIALAYLKHLPLRAKETCFGLMLEGERDCIRGFLDLLRGVCPDGLYLKRRAFSIGDTKICARTFPTGGVRRAAEHFRRHCGS